MTQNFKVVLRQVFVILMFTFIPVLIIRQLWTVIVENWLIIFPVLLLGVASIFEYIYFSGLSMRSFISKLKRFFTMTEPNAELPEKRALLSAERREGFLIGGIALDIIAFYFLNRYFRF